MAQFEKTVDSNNRLTKTGLLILSISIFLFLQGCGNGSGTTNNGSQSKPVAELYNLQGFPFDVNQNNFIIFNHKVANVYQIKSSPDRKMAIFSVVQKGMQPDLFIASINSSEIKQITSDQYIKFDPAINNFGDYAYARHERDVSQSKIFVNDEKIDLPVGLYKNLALHNNILVMHYAQYYDDTDWLIVYDIKNKTKLLIKIDIVPDFIAFYSDTEIVMEGLNHTNYKNEILLYDIKVNKFSFLKNSDMLDSCFLDDHQYGKDIKFVCFTPEQVKERLLFLGLRHLKENDPAGTLACSNNDLGRLSWNISYRLQGLLALHASGVEVDYPVERIIKNIADCIITGAQKDADNIGWPTTKYSISGTDKLSLLVDNAMIIYPLLQAVNQNLVDDLSKNKIITLAEEMFDWYEAEYNSATKIYHFKKGISFWADGLWLPYNMQNVFGLALIELYKATKKEKYKLRAVELAARFRSEWVLLDDGRSLWHYWPQDYYDGWSAEEGLSVNTPSQALFLDERYEDVSHAGLNVKFIFEIHSNFAESPFSTNDIDSLNKTLQGFRYGNIYSRFISGDVDYQSASRRFIPSYGWLDTKDSLLIEHISNGLPFSYPLFEGDIATEYLRMFYLITPFN